MVKGGGVLDTEKTSWTLATNTDTKGCVPAKYSVKAQNQKETNKPQQFKTIQTTKPKTSNTEVAG